MLGAPILVLTLLYFILAEVEPVVKVAVINAPVEYAERLDEYNIMVYRCDWRSQQGPPSRGKW